MGKVVESAPDRLAMQFGSTTLVLDKAAGTATLQRKVLIWSRKPLAKPLADVTDVTLDAATDRASGVEICHVMMVMRTGDAWALAENDRNSAQTSATTIREFLKLKSA